MFGVTKPIASPCNRNIIRIMFSDILYCLILHVKNQFEFRMNDETRLALYLKKLWTFQTKSFKYWIIFWLVIGVMLRLVVIIQAGWRIDFDEAFNGLLAFDILDGEFPLFTPPEVVGGTGSPYLLAMIFSVFGSSAITFRLLSLIWSGLYIVSIGWLAKTAYNQRVAIFAMGFASLAPPYMQFVGMKLWSSYIETILLSNLLFIATFYLLNSTSHQKQLRWMILTGLIAGVMFWLTWVGFYYFVPIGLILLWKGRAVLFRLGWLGLVAFLVGSAPFWIFNIPQGMPTFMRFSSDAPMTTEQISGVLGDFITTRFPILVSGHPTWGYSASGLAVVIAIVYAIGLIFILRKVNQGNPLTVMLTIFVFSVPILYAFSTNSRNALPEFNPWGIDATGRYILMLHSVLPIGVALLIDRLWIWRKQIGLIAFISLLAMNTFGTLTVNPFRAFDSPYYDRLPPDLSPLINFLDERDIHHAWVDGGIGHVLMFLTQEDMLTEDYHSVFLAGGLLRKPDILEQIQSANPTVFITPIYEGQPNPPLQQALENADIPYEMVRVTPTIAVYIIEDILDPMQIAGGLGYQY